MGCLSPKELDAFMSRNRVGDDAISIQPRPICSSSALCLHKLSPVRLPTLGCAFCAFVSVSADEEPRQRPPCMACQAAGATLDPGFQEVPTSRTRLCRERRRRNAALESLLRWVLEVHFRRCSHVLQASLYRAVCHGVQQTLEASAGRDSTRPSFPLSSRLLLAFVGGVTGDGGAEIASFLQACSKSELKLQRSLLRSERPRGSSRGRVSSAGVSLPVSKAYAGHLCLCRHLDDAVVDAHLLWLAREALEVLRLVDDIDANPSANGELAKRGYAGILSELCHCVALVLIRPTRGGDSPRVPPGAGPLLEIVFDSDARPLAGVPRALAASAVRVIKLAGHLQAAQTGDLLGPARSEGVPCDGGCRCSGEDYSNDDVDFRRAPVAFEKCWDLAAPRLDMRVPVLRATWTSQGEGESSVRDGESDQEGSPRGSGRGSAGGVDSWDSVPQEAAVLVSSFLTAKRLCRLACVSRSWRELVELPRVWQSIFEARWPLEALESDDDLSRVVQELLDSQGGHNYGGRRSHKFVRIPRAWAWRLEQVT